MNHKNLQVLFISFFIFLQIFFFNSVVTVQNSAPLKLTTHSSNAVLFPNPHTLQTNIIALNYSNNANFTNAILSKLPPSITVTNQGQSITYSMIYHLIFPTANFLANFTSYINSISTPNSPTVDINQTALAYQAVNFTVQNIFIPKTGTAINGTLLEHWLWTNGQQFRNDNISYQIFLLNLTYIPSKLYWFNIYEPDVVTQQQRQEWRLEWDYPPFGNINNFNVKFPYPGYASDYPMYYLDPSAFNWYLNWTRIWRNIPSQEVANDPYYENSFTGYLQNIGGFEANKSLAGYYIGNWLSEIVNNLFVFQPLNGAVQTPPSLNLQVAIITNSTSSDPFPPLQWIINDSVVTSQIQRLLPNSVISVSTTFYNLSDYSNFSQMLAQYRVPGPSPPPVPDYAYYDANGLFTNITSFDSSFFKPSSARVNLRAYVLVLDNASFVGAPWNGGGLLTGLGGYGRVLILNEVDRFFFNRTTNPVPKESLSKVLIHETGHAIGLPHPFNEYVTQTYASDLISEAMGYYSNSANYSAFFVDNFQRLGMESNISLVVTKLQSLNTTNISPDLLSSLEYNYSMFYKYYHILDFQNANHFLYNLQILINQFFGGNSNNQIHPIINGSISHTNLQLGSSIVITWQLFDYNPNNYEIFINGILNTSQPWNVNPKIITFTFRGETLGVYNITIVASNTNGLSSTFSSYITVVINSSTSSIYTSTSNKTSALDPLYTVLFPILAIISIFYYKKRKKV